MDKRRDALAGAAKLELELREIAARAGEGAVCTMGGVVTRPGIVTSVVERAGWLLGQRQLDAHEVARAGVPTVIVFVQSLRGLAHTKPEDTKEEHLELSVQALDRLADKTIARVAAG